MPDLELLRASAPTVAPPSTRTRIAGRAALEERMLGLAPSASPRRRGRRRRWAVLAVAATAAGAAAVALSLSLGGEEPASAAGVLREAAAAAERQPAPPPLRPGQYAYTRSSTAWLSTFGGTKPADGGNSTLPTFSALVGSEREIWLGPDGRGRLRQTAGAVTWPSEQDRERWIAAGRPSLDGGLEDMPIENGDGPDVPMATLTLTDDPDELRAQLEAEFANDPKGRALAPRMFTAVGDYLRETATTPAQRAALYEVASTIAGVELVGDATDAAGRSGTAVALDDPEHGLRRTLVFDPDTGALLEERDVALASNGMGLEAGAPLGRATYLESSIVDEIPPR